MKIEYVNKSFSKEIKKMIKLYDPKEIHVTIHLKQNYIIFTFVGGDSVKTTIRQNIDVFGNYKIDKIEVSDLNRDDIILDFLCNDFMAEGYKNNLTGLQKNGSNYHIETVFIINSKGKRARKDEIVCDESKYGMITLLDGQTLYA